MTLEVVDPITFVFESLWRIAVQRRIAVGDVALNEGDRDVVLKNLEEW